MDELTLTEAERKLVAFALFRLAMKIGPEEFRSFSIIAVKIGVVDELEFYANDWLKTAKAKNDG